MTEQRKSVWERIDDLFREQAVVDVEDLEVERARDDGPATVLEPHDELTLVGDELGARRLVRKLSHRAGSTATALPIPDNNPQRSLVAVPTTAPTVLRPFFGFYGGKWRDAQKYYPAPEHPTIVEPFAGSAGYSLRFPERKVILHELDPILAEVWRYLIKVKPSEILAIRDMEPEDSVDDLKVCQEAKWLVGLWLNRGVVRPRKTPSKWMRDGIRPGSFWGERVRNTIASQVEAIRHWEIHNKSYSECSGYKNATWFIDPPYQQAGQHYRFGSTLIDYAALARWCKARSGQVIVCENAGTMRHSPRNPSAWTLPFRCLHAEVPNDGLGFAEWVARENGATEAAWSAGKAA